MIKKLGTFHTERDKGGKYKGKQASDKLEEGQARPGITGFDEGINKIEKGRGDPP